MNKSLDIATDCASIAVYDLAVLQSYGRDDVDEEFDFENIQGVKERLFFGFCLGSDGVYRVRITDGDLTETEKDYATTCLKGLGIRVESGRIYLGGYGVSTHVDGYVSFDLESGQYAAEVYEISYGRSPMWHPDYEGAGAEAPADVVIKLRKVDNLPTPTALPEMRLDSFSDDRFLFPSETRVSKTSIGAVMKSVVIKSPRAPQGYYLRQCGVEHYKVDLEDYSCVDWHDRVKFRVTGIDHEEQMFRGVFLEKQPPESG